MSRNLFNYLAEVIRNKRRTGAKQQAPIVTRLSMDSIPEELWPSSLRRTCASGDADARGGPSVHSQTQQSVGFGYELHLLQCARSNP